MFAYDSGCPCLQEMRLTWLLGHIPHQLGLRFQLTLDISVHTNLKGHGQTFLDLGSGHLSDAPCFPCFDARLLRHGLFTLTRNMSRCTLSFSLHQTSLTWQSCC